jgi:hypothetical protein
MRTRFTALTGVMVVVAMMAAPFNALGSSTRMACHKPATGCSHHVSLSAGCCALTEQAAAPASVPVTPAVPLPDIDASSLIEAFRPAPVIAFHLPPMPPRAALLDRSTLFSTLLI